MLRSQFAYAEGQYRNMYGFAHSLGEEDKERIIKEFLPYIKFTAHRMEWRLPPQLTVDDLISAGLMGLLDALEKFEPGRVKLKTYAEKRIKGSMLDEIRAADWLPRSAKKRVDDLKGTHTRLQAQLGRAPEDEEVAEALGITLDDFYATMQEARGAMSIRFEDFGEGNDGLQILDSIADPAAVSPLGELLKADMQHRIAEQIKKLAEKERLVLSLYYWDELTMKEIGKVLDLTESRVCQLHGKALLKLKSVLGEVK